MSARASVKGVAAAAVGSLAVPALMGLLIWAYLTFPPAVVITWAVLGLVVTAAAVAAAVLTGDRADPFTATTGHGSDADAYLEPLRRPGAAEENLDADLHRRRMLLRPHGLTHRHARALATRVRAQARRRRARAAMAQQVGRERLASAGEKHAAGLSSVPAAVSAEAAGPVPVTPENDPALCYRPQVPFTEWEPSESTTVRP